MLWPEPPTDCPVCRALTGPEPGAIIYPISHRIGDVRRADRIRGALLGLLVADALGRMRDEGHSPDWARVLPGTLAAGGAGQLSLFTAEGVLRMMVRLDIKGIGPAFGVMRHAYDGWMFTQSKVPPKVRDHWVTGGDHWPVGWLVRRHELHRVVGGFAGTISSLQSLDLNVEIEAGEFNHRVNKSEGSGAVVRAAPIGCLFSPDEAFEVGVRNAGYTHGGATAYLGAGYLAALVSRLVAGIPLRNAMVETLAQVEQWPHSARSVAVIQTVLGTGSPGTDLTHANAALLHGLRPLLFLERYEEAVSAALDEGGTAAAVVAGAVWGASHGARMMPAVARTASELSSVAEELADALTTGHRQWVQQQQVGDPARFFDGSFTANILWERFPGW